MGPQAPIDGQRDRRGGLLAVTVGVVGDGPLADRVREVAAADGESVTDGPDSDVLAADPDAVVAVSESALLALAREDVAVPVLPVEAGPGYGGVGEDDLTDAVESLIAGEFDAESRAMLDVSVGDERVGRALADVMLVTTEPARISEYAIRSGDERVEQFRADGVVVSTPTGSHGYGRNAGGPLLEPGSGVVGVVPVAPFAVNADHWVLSADRPLTLSVERDEGEVSLLLDDRVVREVTPHTSVEVSRDGTISVARVPESRSFFER
jgi:NAD+ kinase